MTVIEKIGKIVIRFPEKIAITQRLGLNRKITLTFSQLEGQSNALANQLIKQGLSPGQMAGVFMERSPAHVVAMLAILKANAAFFSLNPRLSLAQVTYSQKLCQAPILFVDNNTLIRLNRMDPQAFEKLRILHLSSGPISSIHQNILRKMPRVKSIELENSTGKSIQAQSISSGPALALFTSGSTGNPKGVLISRQDLFNRVMQEIEDYELSPADRLLGLLPFSFDVGLNQLFSALMSGAELILSNSWLPQDICTAVQTCNISGISAVPTIWTEIMTLPKSIVQSTFKKIRYITISGGDLTAEQLHQLRKFMPTCGIYKTYGQTETFRSGILKPPEFEHKMTSVGRAVNGTQVFILNKQGKQAEADEVGQIIHGGTGKMLGYVGDTNATRQKLQMNPLKTTDSQPVIYTGDLGKIDADGYLYVLGRQDKMLKINGYRVYPIEIQAAIISHETVLETAVFGVKSNPGGTQIFAEVRCKNDSHLSEQVLKQYLSQRLPTYMLPARIIFVESFPRTPSGKIKLALVEEKYHE